VRLAGLILLLIPIAAQCADEDGIRVGQVQFAYFVEPVRVNISGIDPSQAFTAASQAFTAEVAATLARSETSPTAITVNGRTTVLPPKAPTTRAEFDTWVAPLSRQYQESILTGFADTKWQEGKTVIDRFVRDNFRHIYVTYAVAVEVLPTGNYRATFGESQAPLPESVSSGWKVVPLMSYPAPQLLQDGDRITLELYSDDKTGQKVVEDIHFGKQESIVLRKGAARAVYADDDLKIVQPRVRKNGLPQELSEVGGTLDGPVLWIYIPGDGRYVLSMRPQPELGFERAGEVAGNSLQFVLAGNIFRVDCAERIADAGSGTYVVYALQDSTWEPPDLKERTRTMMGALAKLP
jgi:hypothetical protein